ncbi:MAG: hypothetical protein MJ175_02895, partial [Clostridia bacterium]|nr:hypothetical protein [Clostridia bacterium]
MKNKKLTAEKRHRRGFRNVLAMILAMLTLFSAVPVNVLAWTAADNRSRTDAPVFSEAAISAMQEVCGDQYDAVDVLGALYQMGAVDETGMPILADSYVVDGQTVNTAELRAMADSHLTDAEDTAVTVDGTVLTWGEIRSIFAVSDMEEYLRAAEENGIAMNDDDHIVTANSLMKWLENGGAGTEDVWHPVTHVGHIGAETFYDGITQPYYWKDAGSYISEQELNRTNLYGDPAGEAAPARQELNDVFAPRYTTDHPERLWLPSAQKNFVGKDFADCTLVLDQYGDEYNGEYDYLSQIDFYLNLQNVIANSGYDAKKVRITLHAESEEDLSRVNGGFLSLDWCDVYSEPDEPAIDQITLDDSAYAAMLSDDGLTIGVVDMEEFRDGNGLLFSLRAFSEEQNQRKHYYEEDTLGCIRAAGLYMTFDVIGDRVAPAASKYNTRLWLIPVDGKADTYKLNPYYMGMDTEEYSFHTKYNSEYRIPGIAEKIAENGYIDLMDNITYLGHYVLAGNAEMEYQYAVSVSDAAPAPTQSRLFLDPVSAFGTEYRVNTTLTSEDMVRRYGFTSDVIYDIPDTLITSTLTYAFLDYDSFIQSFTDSADVRVGSLTVNANSASMPYSVSGYGYHQSIPAIIWDSASCDLTRFEGYEPESSSRTGTLSTTYTGNGRAVLVQARLLSYLMSYSIQNPGQDGATFNHLTETPWAFSQYGIYDKDNGTIYPHFDFTYNANNPAADENLHIIAPAMTYYKGDIIPIIVRNPNGVFGTPEGSDANERRQWAMGFRLTVNGRELAPAEVSFRPYDAGKYGIDMLVFLYTVGDFEADMLNIGTATISYNGGTQFGLVNDLRGDPDHGIAEETVKMKTFDWSSMLLMNGATVGSDGEDNYLEIPIRSFTKDEDPDGTLKGELIQQINNCADSQNDFRLKNAFAVLSMDGDPRLGDERTPMYAVVSGLGTSDESYKSVRIPLPSVEENNGEPVVFVRIYTGTPLTGGTYVSYDSSDLNCGAWNCDGFQLEGGRYRTLGTEIVRLPKITYYENPADFTLVYNDTWNTYAEGLKYREYKKAGKPAIVLSYLAPLANDDGYSYSYADAKYFQWKSDNESIATVKNQTNNGVTMAVITPTGVVGDVTFTLTCANGGGDHTMEIKSLTLHVVEDSPEAYLSIPETLTPLVVRRNAAASVTFASNIQQANALCGQDTTDFTLSVYEARLEDGRLVKASDTPVYQKTETASEENPVYAIRIPENILDKVSPSGSESYLAIISAVNNNEEKQPAEMADSSFAAEVPVKVRNYPVELSITSQDNPYMLGGDTYTATFAIENANSSYDWRYYITDENGIMLDEYSSAGTGIFDKTTLTFTAPEVDKVLKRSYTLTVAASNDVDSEGWTMAVKTLYVYNRNALDILVGASESVTVADDHVTMDNRNWLSGYLSSDGKTINLGSGGISFGELQTDAHLDSLISLNYGDYAWGLISDAIEWKVTDTDGSDPVDLYYKKMGVFSDTEASGLDTYLPTTDFSLIAVRDGEATVTAKHALSGITSSITVDVDVLDHELVLFQFYPPVTTNVTYTLTNGETVTVKSDGNGQMALYEAEKIDDDTRFYLSSSENGTEYVGMGTMRSLKSGERNALNGKTYPVNLIKLQRPAELHLYFSDAEGKPIANENFTIRGGVYYDGEYAAHADLFDESNRALGDLAGDVSNGLNDIIYTSDENGMIRIFFNMNQFTSESEVDPAKALNYIFEVRRDGFYPEIVFVDPYKESNVVVNLKAVEEEKANKPFMWEFGIKSYSGAGVFTGYLPFDDSTVNVGPNSEHPRVSLEVETALWGLDDLIDRTSGVTKVIDNPGSQYFTDEGAAAILGSGASESSQDFEFWAYPFSSFVFCNTKLDANPLTVGWFEEETPVPMDLQLFDAEGTPYVSFPFDYALYKDLEQTEPVASENLEEQAEKQREQIKKATENFGLGDLVPGGDILSTGLTFLTSAASGGDYGMYFKVSPTADPTVYYILISVSDEDPNDDDDDDKNYKIEPSYEDIQNLGAEAISSIRGSQHHYVDYEMKKKGLAATLKKEQEDMWVAGKKKDENEDKKDDDDDDDDGLGIKIGGSLIARATYDPEKDDWNLAVCGGSVQFKWQAIDWNYHKNLIVCYVPFTVSIGVKAELDMDIGGRVVKMPSLNKEDTLFRVNAGIKGEIEGFGGLGLDVSVIAVKIGLYGKFEAAAEVNCLKTEEGPYKGAQITLKGELGVKFVFKALVVDYEYEICSILKFGGKDGKKYTAGDFDKIQDIWEGNDVTGKPYLAMAECDDRLVYTIERTAAAAPLMAPASVPGTGIFRTYEKDEELENLIYSEDGQKIFYLDDGVAFMADAMGITEQAIADNEESDFGQFYLDAAGRNENYAAAWVTQTCESRFDDYYEPTAADLAAAMNSTEITAAVYENGRWVTERLTANGAPDLAPTVAVSDDGRYVLVAWRSVYNSDPDAPLTFDVDDNIMYRIWDRTTGTWSETQTAYNGIANGSVYALDSAVFDNGNALIAFTVQTASAPEGEEQDGLETFYAFLENKDGIRTNTTVRVTDNTYMDANAQLLKLSENGTEYAVLGWYAKGEKSDICLRVFDADGKIDESYPASAAEVSGVRISEKFRLAGSARDDLMIGWINAKMEDGAAAASGDLCAVRIYSADDGSFHAAPAQTLAASCASVTVDDFALYFDGTTVSALLAETDYSS